MSDHIRKLLRFFKSDQAELRKADTGEVTETALELLAQQEREEFVDIDLLVTAGRKFRLAGHDSIDTAVESWLMKQPVCRRFDISSMFLSGYWGAGRPVRESLAKQIVEQLPHCESDPDALPSMLVALSQIFQTAASDETRLLVRNTLAAYQSRAAELKLEPGTVDLINEATR
jgi:hypothetical protein